MFIDAHGREITYLRISVTDRCDFRCVYCMSEDMTFMPRSQLLTLEEIARLAKIFAENGVRRFRLTGGEPLIRKNLVWLVNELSGYPNVQELAITTNGSRLSEQAAALKAAGITKLNISVDTLDVDKFKAITRIGHLPQVLSGILAAKAAGIGSIRLNSVIMRGQNDDQILPLIAFARQHALDIAFIEEMPLGDIAHNREKTFIASDEIRQTIHQRYPLTEALIKPHGGPARYWVYDDGVQGKVGFISPQSCNFCATCNRVRLTAEGRLLLCLGHEDSLDLRAFLRSGKSDYEIAQAIQQGLQKKPEKHEFTVQESPVVFRHMSHTGG